MVIFSNHYLYRNIEINSRCLCVLEKLNSKREIYDMVRKWEESS